jgi:hypothetical protein
LHAVGDTENHSDKVHPQCDRLGRRIHGDFMFRLVFAFLLIICSVDVHAESGSFPDQFNNLIDTTLLEHPQLGPAFESCLKIVSVYQANLISRLTHDADASTTKSQQQLLLARAGLLRPAVATGQRVACAKQFLVSLKIIPERGYYKDALILMNSLFKGGVVTLKGTEFDIIRNARSKLNDMTDAGIEKLADELSFGSVNQQNLLAEIESPQKASIMGVTYLGCMLPVDWTSWFILDTNEMAYCHGASLERALTIAAGGT